MAAVVQGARRVAPALPAWRVISAATATATATAAFSTTASAAAKGPVQHIRKGRQTQTTKKKKSKMQLVATAGRPIAPGERKAYRKRVVLSNSNALAVPGLAEMAAPDLAEDAGAVGTVRALPDGLVDQLRAVDAFKPTQAAFALFRRPSLLVRAETAALAARLQQAAAQRQTLRLVVDGERRAGKSTLLQQALAHAFLNDWLVISIPEAHELTAASTEYAALGDGLWAQPVYTLRLLQAVQAANAPLLGRFVTARAHDQLAHPVAAGSTLLQLVAAAREPDHAWPVLLALLDELAVAPDAGADAAAGDVPRRPPLLFALDNLAHVMRPSAYRSPAYEPIHAHDLALVRLFVDALAGRRAFPHGAAVLAATSRGSAPATPTMDLALAAAEARGGGGSGGSGSGGSDAAAVSPPPYARDHDARVAEALRSVEVLRLRGVSKPEARALLEYWAASGVLRDRVDEQAVAGAWALAGHGVVGELERAALLSLRAA